MSWRDEQRWFWEQIRRREPPGGSEEQLALHLAGRSRISRRTALNIYHNAYHQRLLHFAGELYPVMHRTLDTATFNRLWLDYFRKHPPAPGPVSDIGRALPDFLDTDPHYHRLPALLDIAILENHFITLFEAPDERSMTRNQLQALPPDQWPSTRWPARQDWALMRSAFDLPGYWEKLRAHFSDPEQSPGSAPFGVDRLDSPQWFLIHRQQQTMQLRRLTGPMAVFLQDITSGNDFAAQCQHLSEQYPDRDIPSLSLALLLQAIDWELLACRD
jgi:hypothetical protein